MVVIFQNWHKKLHNLGSYQATRGCSFFFGGSHVGSANSDALIKTTDLWENIGWFFPPLNLSCSDLISKSSILCVDFGCILINKKMEDWCDRVLGACPKWPEGCRLIPMGKRLCSSRGNWGVFVDSFKPWETMWLKRGLTSLLVERRKKCDQFQKKHVKICTVCLYGRDC